jgi:2-oxoglutarate ferredoxin oxidoreductase subunit gamma
MAERYELRLSGEGGQGLVLAGKILAEAAAIYDDKNATQSQSYGPEARGGASKSEVIVADGAIDYPKAERLDLLLALTQEAFDKYHGDLRPGGWLVIDAEAVTRLPDVSKWKLVPVPFEKLARERVGKSIVANIVAIGVIVRLSRVVTEQAAEQAILARVPPGTEDLNRKAFQLGLEAAEQVPGWAGAPGPRIEGCL